MTCLSRACSVLATNHYYKSDDSIVPLLLPNGLKPFLHISLARRLFTKVAASKGIYEYVIARTKYIDAVFRQALAEQFDQILIFGAGFDTRALRFQDAMANTRAFRKARISLNQSEHPLPHKVVIPLAGKSRKNKARHKLMGKGNANWKGIC
jgi:hypothetical protein